MKKIDINNFSPDDNKPSKLTAVQDAGVVTWRVTSGVFSFLFKTIMSLLVILIITGAIVGCTMFSYLMSLRDATVEFDLNMINMPETSYVYATNADGETIEVAELHDIENRQWVSLGEMPKNLQNAFIALEDKRFNEHQGVDWIRTAFAIGNLVFKWSDNKDGGSTITQQLIKNLTQDDDVSIQRKLQEIFKALNLEQTYSKDLILEAYLNVINLGVGSYGVQAASEAYFGKDVSDLTLVECASIAAITQNPVFNNPKYAPTTNKERRNTCLWYMWDNGFISETEYKAAIKEELVLRDASQNLGSNITIDDWYTDLVKEDVINDLMKEYDLSLTAATYQLYSGGLRIYSAVDMNLQNICEDIAQNGVTMGKLDDDLQIGVYFTDYEGRVLATVGRSGEKTQNRYFSYATDAIRQPGSAMKPLAVYGPAIEYGLVDWSTMIEDRSLGLNGKNWPTNAYGHYKGDITVQSALEFSANPCAVRVLQMVGYENSFRFVTEKFHLSTLYEDITINGKQFSDINASSLALGGTTEGVKMNEMVEAYAVYGNGGKYYEPYSYYYVANVDQDIILDNTGTKVYEQVMSTPSADLTRKLLEAVVDGPGASAYNARISPWDIYGKTGSTSDNKDRLFVGGTPYCVGGVWLGYEIPAKINTWYHPSVPVWREIMVKYLSTKQYKTFKTSNKLEQRYYCTKSGGFATSACPSAKLGWYKKDGAVTTVCTEHNGGHEVEQGDKWEYEDPTSSEETSSQEQTSSQEPASSKEEVKPDPVTSTPPPPPVTSAPAPEPDPVTSAPAPAPEPEPEPEDDDDDTTASAA